MPKGYAKPAPRSAPPPAQKRKTLTLPKKMPAKGIFAAAAKVR